MKTKALISCGFTAQLCLCLCKLLVFSWNSSYVAFMVHSANTHGAIYTYPFLVILYYFCFCIYLFSNLWSTSLCIGYVCNVFYILSHLYLIELRHCKTYSLLCKCQSCRSAVQLLLQHFCFHLIDRTIRTLHPKAAFSSV